ncbi:MAG: cytochrome c maturation protein CcmE [Edaphocola sp.]
MKKANIVILVVIAAAIGIIVASLGKFSTYETFASAASKPESTFHVVGYLDTSLQQQYDPIKDPNNFTFFAKDKQGAVHKVIFNGARPQDFEKSEQLVMTGYMKGNDFHCSKIQMKCPSKYENDQIAVAQPGSKAS